MNDEDLPIEVVAARDIRDRIAIERDRPLDDSYSDWERGLVDGLDSAVDIIDSYIREFSE